MKMRFAGFALLTLCYLCATAEQRGSEFYRKAGYVEQPGSQKGVFSFISTQSDLHKAEIDKVAALLNRNLLMRFEVVEAKPGDPASLVKASKGPLGVVVVSDETTPTMLLAPEDGWGVVNVRKLANFATPEAKSKFFADRCRRELIRAFSGVAGGLGSTYQGNIMSVTKIEELELVPEGIPYDKIRAAQDFLRSRGYSPLRRAPYFKACQEGWAPAPTNEYQKAIWDKVHEIPSKPLKIEYNEKRDKGK